MKKMSSLLAILLVVCVLLTGCTTSVAESEVPVASAPVESTVVEALAEESTVEPSEAEAPVADNTEVYTLSEEAQTLVDSGDFKKRELSGDYDEFEAVALTADNADITAGGTYVVSGALTDTTITVTVEDTEKVQIVLDNAQIENSQGPAIYIVSADKVYLTALEGTENVISDGTSYEMIDGETTVDAAVYSRADLAINGGGSLTVNGNCKHGVVSKDDLALAIENLDVTAQSAAIEGKDCVRMAWGNVTVNAGSDGIRSDNAEDADRGYIYVVDGSLDITCGNDGIQAENYVKLLGGTYNILSGGGTAGTVLSTEDSYKGIKSATEILISGGDYTIDALDDCIHSVYVNVEGGTFLLASGDDGLHADEDLNVSGGDIWVTESYEGLEGTIVNISGGNIYAVASDDGINAAGGNDNSGFGGMFPGGPGGPGGFGSMEGEINISGGYIVVDASGDGIDSNNTINISGGVTLVSGPTMAMNGAFDCDGQSTVTGGVLVATGAAGMAQGIRNAENQGTMFVSFNNQVGGTPIALCDSDGNVVVSFTPMKDYQTAVVTAPAVQTGNTYTLVVGGEVSGADENGYAENTAITGGETAATIEMTSNNYSAGGFGGFGGGPGGMMPGGGRP